MSNENDKKLIQIIKQQDWLMSALSNVRDLKLPDWYIAAGAIRNTVWNYLHSYSTTPYQQDIDVVYFDVSDMNGEKEKASEVILKKKSPNFHWEVVNQAKAHLFEHGPKLAVKSSCESIAYWSETPTCVGIRLEKNERFTICAPHGLNDLLNLIVRPVPKPYQDLILYKERIRNKNWNKFWPQLKIIVPIGRSK